MPRLEVPKKWDYETDVLIIGGGTAGMPAGIAAVEAGAKATILELMNMSGGSGNVIQAGGCFAGTDWQKKAGIQDSSEKFYKDGTEVALGSPEMWRVYADNQLDTYKWLTEEVGCLPVRNDLMNPPGHRTPRLHPYVGADVEKAIEKLARKKGVEILFEHRAMRLYTNPETDRVLGCLVNAKGKMQNFKARRAVILASGGFGRNKDLLREYGVRFINNLAMMSPGHLGDGFKMALELGAATKDIGTAVTASLPICTTTRADRALWSQIYGAITVNVNGKRFYDESCPKGFYGQLTDAGMDQPDGVYWFVYDSEMRKAPLMMVEMPKQKEYKADTLEELAKQAGINPKGLKETVAKYNSDIESEGYDTVFGRKTCVSNQGTPVPLKTPPFYAIKCVTSITSLKGGLKINSRCQCVNQYDEVIPGLYACGEVAGGLFGKGVYLGGCNWSSAMTFGRVAARNAVVEKPWS